MQSAKQVSYGYHFYRLQSELSNHYAIASARKFLKQVLSIQLVISEYCLTNVLRYCSYFLLYMLMILSEISSFERAAC